MSLKNIGLLFFTPSKFIQVALDDSLHKYTTTPQELEESTQQNMQKSTHMVRSAVFNALRTLIAMIIFAFIISGITKALELEIASNYIVILRFLSGCSIFLAIWGKAGWDIQTWDGNTLPEQVNSRLSKYLYITGMWIMLVTYLI